MNTSDADHKVEPVPAPRALKRGDRMWWAQRTGVTVSALILVRVAGRVDWAPGVFVEGVEDSKRYNVSERDLWPLDAVRAPE